jgi:Mg-chelatase subunit ChlD
MNPEQPRSPREELETRLTALLLGELSPEEAAATRRAIAQDATLAELFQRLRVTIELVQHASLGVANPSTPESAPLRLSEERRKQLFTQFQAKPLPTLGFRSRRRTSWLVPISIAVAMLAMIGVTSFFLFPGDFARMEMGIGMAKHAPLGVTPLPGIRGDDASSGAIALGRRFSSESVGERFYGLPMAPPPPASMPVPEPAPKPGSSIVLPSVGSSETTTIADGAEGAKMNLYAWHADTRRGAITSRGLERQSEAPAVRNEISPNFAHGVERGFLAGQSTATLKPEWDQSPSPQMSAEVAGRFSAGDATFGGFDRKKQAQESDRQKYEWAARPAAGGRDSDRDKVVALDDLPTVGNAFYSRHAPGAQDAVAPQSPASTTQPSTLLGGLAGRSAGAMEFGMGKAGEKVAGRTFTPLASAAPAQEQQRAAARERFARGEQFQSLDVVGYTAVPLSSKDASAVGTDEYARKKISSIVLPPADSGLALGVEPAKVEGAVRAKIAPTRPSSGIARDENSRLVQDGRLLFELGKHEAAEKKLQEALNAEPENRAAAYYLDLAKDAQHRDETRKDNHGTRMVAAGLSATEDHLSEGRRRSSTQTRGASVVSAEKVAAQVKEADLPIRKPATNAPVPQPEIQTVENAFSTFSLNVSDVAFKLAAASLEKGQMPDAASVRAEEFINAFDYRDSEAPPGVPVAFAWERTRYPFAHNRDLLRFSLKTGAAGRQAGRPLNVVLLLDNSGSMERADRVQIIREALRVLAGQLQPQDKLSVISFARTARLVADGVSGDNASQVLEQVSGLTPQGGTNLEEAMNLGYATALRHYLANGLNRVVLLTDGAANLGNVEPESLKQKVEAHRKQGVALDCFGIGWEGFNDDLLEVLSRNGDGRYGFINSPEAAATEFAAKLAGALQVVASDVKVQVEFNAKRVTAYRQVGYAKHQLTKEQFRDNTVDAAEIAAQEAGNALYTVAVNPAGEGPLCIVRCRFKIPGTMDYREHEWVVPFTGSAVALEQANPAMRLAATASAFAEWLVVSPFAAEVTPDALLGYLSGVPEIYGADARPKKLEWMIWQAKSLAGR